jgi:predicted PurR-regulated permease PerM
MSAGQRQLFPGSGLLIFVLCCSILYLAQEVLIPVALAALLALLLAPLVDRLCRARCPNIAAVLIAVGLVALFLMGGLWLVARELTAVIGDMPKYRDTILTRIHDFNGSRVGAIADSVSDLKKELSEAPAAKDPEASSAPKADQAKPRAAPGGHAEPIRIESGNDLNFRDYLGLAGTALHPFSLTAMVLLLATFMLVQREDLHDRFLILSGRIVGRHHQPVSIQAIDEALTTVSRYLWMQSGSNACMATLILIGLLSLGIHNAFLWGSLCFFLRFIPYVGIIIGAGVTFAFSIATAPDVGTPFLVLGLFAIVEICFSSLLEPIFFAHNTGISSLAILISALFWTWIWGIVGLFLSVPLTVCWVMIGRNFENFDFLDTLLSSRSQLPPEKLLYYRLLVMDPADYSETIDRHAHAQSFEKTFDEVMVPTICLAESELHAERITQERFDTMLVSLRLSMEERIDGQSCALERSPAAAGPSPGTQLPVQHGTVLSLAAHGELDQLASSMVSMALEIHGSGTITIPMATPHGLMERIAANHVHAVCISALGSQSTMRAIAWARVLRHQFPDLVIVIGHWNPSPVGSKRLERDKGRYRYEVVTSLKGAVLLLCPGEKPAPADAGLEPFGLRPPEAAPA